MELTDLIPPSLQNKIGAIDKLCNSNVFLQCERLDASQCNWWIICFSARLCNRRHRILLADPLHTWDLMRKRKCGSQVTKQCCIPLWTCIRYLAPRPPTVLTTFCDVQTPMQSICLKVTKKCIGKLINLATTKGSTIRQHHSHSYAMCILAFKGTRGCQQRSRHSRQRTRQSH